MKQRHLLESKYKGDFNWYGETITLYTQADSEKKAKINFISQLEKKLNISSYRIKNYFGNKKDNFQIIQIKKRNMNIENIKEAFDKFINDDFVGAKEILRQEIAQARNKYIERQLDEKPKTIGIVNVFKLKYDPQRIKKEFSINSKLNQDDRAEIRLATNIKTLIKAKKYEKDPERKRRIMDQIRQAKDKYEKRTGKPFSYYYGRE
jgi:hypothetical protein